MKAQIIQQTFETWTREPDKARGKPSVTARSEQSRALIEAGQFKLSADLPPSLGGSNEAPSPTALLLGALSACAVVFITDTLGPQLGVRVERVEATASCETDARGLLAMNGAIPDLSNVRLNVNITSPDGDAGVQKLAAAWRERCPIYLALTKPLNVSTDFKAS